MGGRRALKLELDVMGVNMEEYGIRFSQGKKSFQIEQSFLYWTQNQPTLHLDGLQAMQGYMFEPIRKRWWGWNKVDWRFKNIFYNTTHETDKGYKQFILKFEQDPAAHSANQHNHQVQIQQQQHAQQQAAQQQQQQQGNFWDGWGFWILVLVLVMTLFGCCVFAFFIYSKRSEDEDYDYDP